MTLFYTVASLRVLFMKVSDTDIKVLEAELDAV